MEDKEVQLLVDMITSLTKTVNQRFDKLEEQNALEHNQLMQAIKE